MRRGTVRCAIVAGGLTLAVLTPARGDASPAPFAGWAADQVAPGVTVYSGTLGAPSATQFWTVTVRMSDQPPGGTDPDAPTIDLGDRAQADALAAQVRAAGFTPRVEQVDWPAFSDSPHGALGWRVRVGTFADQAAATAQAAAVTAKGLTAAADWTGQDGGAGPQKLHVAVIDPRAFTGSVRTTYGQAVSGRETTSAMSAAGGALVAVNGGFFVIDDVDGIPGEPAGIAVHDGVLQSEASNGRASLVLGSHASIGDLSSHLTVRSGSATRVLDGVNRKPGTIRDCGGVGGDQPTQQPRQDMTCTDPSELVLLTPQLGGTPPSGDGVEAVLDAHDRVTALRPRGGPVPAGGTVLQGIGDGASWLTAHAKPGATLRLDERVTDQHGRAVPRGSDVVNGGPELVRDGRVSVDAVRDGVVHPGEPSFVYDWGVRRNPRTMAGVDAAGRLLLVTVDGRQPGVSEGFSLIEEARFMRSLGAVDAMNLDGGGSTAFTIGGTLVNTPSDATGERPVGEAVEVLPR